MQQIKKNFTSFIIKHGTRWGLGLMITLIAGAQTLGYINSSALDRLDIYFYDLRVKVQTPQMDQRIAIVDIDEKSLSEIGRFPWSRHIMADLVTKLMGHYHAKTIGFDIQFSEPDLSSGYSTLESLAKTDFKNLPTVQEKLTSLKSQLDYDGHFVKALENKPVVLGFSFSEKIKRGILPAPAFSLSDLNGRSLLVKQSSGYEANIAKLQNAARAAGFFNEEVDADGILRSTPLIVQHGSEFYESLGLATVRVALGATRIRPQFFRNTSKDYGVLEELVLNTQPVETRIPVEALVKVQIDYRGAGGPDGGGFKYISATDVLHERVPVDELAQRIVLVGTTAPGLNDLRATPMNNQFPGVEAHANIIASVLDNHFKHNPDYSDAFNLFQVVIIGIMLIVGLGIFRPIISILYTSAIIAVIISFNFWAYRSADLVLPIATALVLIFMLFIFNLIWGYWFEFRQGRAMTHLFGEYVAPELVEVMSEDPEHYSMEGEKRELTIMFSDVRGFTSISEALEPNDLREYINIYLTTMSTTIYHSRGTLDKYIGDCVMAFWGAPITFPDHATRAVHTALIMQQTVIKLNSEFVARGWPPLQIGIGLNTGEVRVGDMGSKIRRAYTVMGDPVNVASRLEGITKEYGVGIIIGEATKKAAPEFIYRELDWVRVKGKNEPVAIFQPLGLPYKVDGNARAALEQWHQALALYRAQKWDEAAAILGGLLETQPKSKLYQRMLTHIDYYRGNPPGADWDGVTNFKTK